MIAASIGTTDDDERAKDDDTGDDSHRRRNTEKPKSENLAPDAVKDPSEKTDGKPGVPPQGNEIDPGAG